MTAMLRYSRSKMAKLTFGKPVALFLGPDKAISSIDFHLDNKMVWVIFEVNAANNTFQVRKESNVIMTFILSCLWQAPHLDEVPLRVCKLGSK